MSAADGVISLNLRDVLGAAPCSCSLTISDVVALLRFLHHYLHTVAGLVEYWLLEPHLAIDHPRELPGSDFAVAVVV